MNKQLLALCVIAALPGCGCWRKKDKTKAPSKEVIAEEVIVEKTTTTKKAKTHMDTQKSF